MIGKERRRRTETERASRGVCLETEAPRDRDFWLLCEDAFSDWLGDADDEAFRDL